MKSTPHASYQTHSPNLGFNKKNRPGAIASENETFQLNKAINALASAKKATTEKEFVELVSTAFNNCRTVCRGRIL